MPISKTELYKLLKVGFPDAEPEILELAADNDHYEVRLASSQFNGLSSVNRHRLVHQALGDIVGTTLHALSLKLTPKN